MIFEETYVSPCVLQGIIKQSEGRICSCIQFGLLTVTLGFLSMQPFNCTWLFHVLECLAAVQYFEGLSSRPNQHSGS